MRRCDIPTAWYEGFYQDKAEPVSAARPFAYLHEERSDEAVLLIHGYAGYPGELVRPAEDLYAAGFDCYVPRLPGMGTSGADFMVSRREDWLGVCRKAIKTLFHDYHNVSIVAHSMGCLIAVALASEFPARRVVLAAPAFSIPSLDPLKLKVIAPFRKRLDVKWESDERYHLHYENAPCDDEKLGHEYWSHVYPKQLLEMEELRKKALSLFPSLRQDVLIITAGQDMITDSSVCTELAALTRSGSTRLVNLENATHYFFYDIDPESEERGVHEVLSFLL